MGTTNPFEVNVIVASLIALTANTLGTVRAVNDWLHFRVAKIRREVPPLECIRALRRVYFNSQAMLAQLVLLGGMVWCSRLPDGDYQARVKNYTFLILAIQLGLKAIVDLVFVYLIDHFPYTGIERRHIRPDDLRRRSDEK